MIRTNSFQDSECATAEYYELPGNFISVNNFDYNLDEIDQDESVFNGTPFTAGCSSWQNGKCHVTPFYPWIDFAPYNVIATDHTSYSIVHTCANYFGAAIKVESYWVLTRKALKIGSDGWKTMLEKVQPIIDEKLPFVDLSNYHQS